MTSEQRGWEEVDVSELETLTGPQCDALLDLEELHETLHCLRKRGHDGRHWCERP